MDSRIGLPHQTPNLADNEAAASPTEVRSLPTSEHEGKTYSKEKLTQNWHTLKDKLVTKSNLEAAGKMLRNEKASQRWGTLTRKLKVHTAIEEEKLECVNKRATVTVYLKNLQKNFKTAVETVNPPWEGGREKEVKVAVVLKSNGYGIGADIIAPQVLEAGARDFFVASVKEAQSLSKDLKSHLHAFREKGIVGEDVNVYVLDGLERGNEKSFRSRVKGLNIVPVLNSLAEVKIWSDFAHKTGDGKKLPAILQFDTGMNRSGMPPYETQILAQRPEEDLQGAFKNLDELGGAGLSDAEITELKTQEGREKLLSSIDVKYVMSHLACASDPDSPENENQLTRFNAVRERFPETPASLSATPGIGLGERYRFDMVRLGSFIHGVEAPAGIKLLPAFKLESKIDQIRLVPANQGIGYGLKEPTVANHDRVIATMPMGFGDGLRRELPKDPELLPKFYIDGEEVPVVSTAMDLTMLDVTAIDKEMRLPGKKVEIVGDSGSLDKLAESYNTIDASITTSLSPRVELEFDFGIKKDAAQESRHDKGAAEEE